SCAIPCNDTVVSVAPTMMLPIVKPKLVLVSPADIFLLIFKLVSSHLMQLEKPRSLISTSYKQEKNSIFISQKKKLETPRQGNRHMFHFYFRATFSMLLFVNFNKYMHYCSKK